MCKRRFWALTVLVLSGDAFAQVPDKSYSVTLSWSEWLKIGAVLDKQSVGDFIGIYNKMQSQFTEQNRRENAAAVESFEKQVREKIEAEKPKEESKP